MNSKLSATREQAASPMLTKNMTDNFEDYGEFSTTSTDEQVEQTSPERETVERAAKPTKKRRIRVCLDYCKYSVIHEICERRGWRQVGSLMTGICCGATDQSLRKE